MKSKFLENLEYLVVITEELNLKGLVVLNKNQKAGKQTRNIMYNNTEPIELRIGK